MDHHFSHIVKCTPSHKRENKGMNMMKSQESGRGKWGLMAWLVLSSLPAAESTSFQECYVTCFIICVLTPGVPASECALKCLQACIVPSFPIDNTANHHPQRNRFFCKLGCAASLCTNFSSNQNPAEKKVGSCVDSCSQTCSMD